jgi:quercetin dioxygenase-like cupin family protein
MLPEDIDWKPFPAFPPPARLAVVVGDPSQPAPYVVRVKVPSGVKLMPHRHHEDRVYTVMSGVFYIGVGEQFDDGQLQAYPPGAVIVLPGGTPHFHWAKSGAYVTQVTAIGPISLEYLDPHDDPRNNEDILSAGMILLAYSEGAYRGEAAPVFSFVPVCAVVRLRGERFLVRKGSFLTPFLPGNVPGPAGPGASVPCGPVRHSGDTAPAPRGREASSTE